MAASLLYPVIALVLFSSCNQAPAGKPATRRVTPVVAAGKPAVTAKRITRVKKKKPAWKPVPVDTSKTYIYLTFDDGPQPGTGNCFRICKNLGVKASFFMVGEHAQLRKMRFLADSIREAYPEVLLANHSYTHAANNHYARFYAGCDTAVADFDRAQDSLQPLWKIARLPGNNSWAIGGNIHATRLTTPASRTLDSAGYNIVGWDVEWEFTKGRIPVQSATEMIAVVNRVATDRQLHAPKHVVLLAHDRMFRDSKDADSLAKMIAVLKASNAYVFETVDHYPGLRINDPGDE
jgi:peptidoglycan/xylan/chitin deacetylase (PgdA/CDA1 family)